MSSTLSAGCDVPRPVYGDYLLTPPQLVKRDRSEVIQRLNREIRAGRVQRLEVQTPGAGLRGLRSHETASPSTDGE